MSVTYSLESATPKMIAATVDLAEALLELRALVHSGSEEMGVIDEALGKAGINPFTEPDTHCDPCGKPMWESKGDNCSSFEAFGIETVACQECRR
tara:strand:- start:446 stop:730 length:285 start_codon:yes stop_codon:yes gene_type:complete